MSNLFRFLSVWRKTMNNREMKLKKFFCTGPAVVVACDHGEFDGPIPGMVDLKETFLRINPEVDGVLVSPGMLRFSGELFTRKKAPLAIGRLNWNTVYCFQWQYHQAVSCFAFSPEEALFAGVEMALVSLTLKTGSEERDARNVAIFRELTGKCHQLGLPVMGEYFPAESEKLSPEELHARVKTGSRILSELGADLVKTFFTVDFEEVVAGCPIPILILGSTKMPSPLQALKLAARAISEGSRGVVFGRNALQVPDSLSFQAALVKVVKSCLAPEEAVKEFNLQDEP